MRIAMVIQRFRPHFSGQGEQLEVLCHELAGRGHELTVLTSSYDCSSSVEETDTFRVVRLRSSLPLIGRTRVGHRSYGPVFAAQVFGYLARHSTFDIVHVHALTDALYSAWLWGRLERHPVIFEMTLVGVDDAVTVLGKRQRLQGFRNHVFRACDGYVAISPALATAFGEAGLSADRLRLVPQGVDVRLFCPSDDKVELRRAIGLPDACSVVTFVGSLIHRKGLDVLLRAWPAIGAIRPDTHLILVGRDRFDDPDETAFVTKQLALLSPNDAARVHRLGIRHDVHRLMQATDVFVFPSRQEGFGTVMIEAMACGVPCVVTELPGITDFIFKAGGKCGLVVRQSDDRALAESVALLLADPQRAARMGRAARSDVLDRFAITTVADQYLSFYHDLLPDIGARSVV